MILSLDCLILTSCNARSPQSKWTTDGQRFAVVSNCKRGPQSVGDARSESEQDCGNDEGERLSAFYPPPSSISSFPPGLCLCHVS